MIEILLGLGVFFTIICIGATSEIIQRPAYAKVKMVGLSLISFFLSFVFYSWYFIVK